MTSIKPITLYSHASGPNPWKVAIVLEELGLPYEAIYPPMNELKQEPYESINPNGRLPSIVDPNTGITLWESCAINKYLVDTYDKENKLTYTTSPEKYLVDQWLFYQASGQGPYFGQAMWFTYFHAEQLPSAKLRYINEFKRVTKVLDGVLAKSEWLVGDKCTIADLSFVTWYLMRDRMLKDESVDFEKEYPHFEKWMKAMEARPSVTKIKAVKAEKMKAHTPGK